MSAAPETDVSALTEAIESGWEDEPTEAEQELARTVACNILASDWYADLTATRERLRVVEGERDAAVRDVVALTNNYVQPLTEAEARAESAEAARDALRADPTPDEALADVWDEAVTYVARVAQVGSCGLNDECFEGNPYRLTRDSVADAALLPGDGR